MLRLTLFIECNNEEEALLIMNECLKLNDKYMSSFKLFSKEAYWKFDGWYKIVFDIETVSPINISKAELILKNFVNKWEWYGEDAISTTNAPDTIFFDNRVRFSSCRFEELTL